MKQKECYLALRQELNPRTTQVESSHRPLFHDTPSLATSLPSFTPSPYSCENKIRKQDTRTEHAGAPPPHLHRRHGKVRPPPFAPLQPPSHTGCTNGKCRGPASSFAQGVWKGTPSPFCPSFSPTRDNRTREPDAQPRPIHPLPSFAHKGRTQRLPLYAPSPPLS